MKNAAPPREVSASDTLVFRCNAGDLVLVGGHGRGLGWAGIVTVRQAEEPRVQAALRSSSIARITEPEPVRVVGPFWSRAAALVPVGDDLVVFGSDEPIEASDGMLARAAAEMVASIGEVPAEKLMADELELVHAVRALMDYRAERVAETARHIAESAAAALSCELAAVLVPSSVDARIAVVTRHWSGHPNESEVRDALLAMRERLVAGPVLDQDLSDIIDADQGAWRGLVARYILPIGSGDPPGILLVAHAGQRPRGFTTLCQRISRALADAADLLIAQALAREELGAERDRFAVQARTDTLTGVGNRSRWEEAVKAARSRIDRHGDRFAVVIADLDDLKSVNDKRGHEVGDAVLQGLAAALTSSARVSDVVARVGGDEFNVLLSEADDDGARSFVERVRHAAAAFPAGHDGVKLRFSAGWATAGPDREIADALRLADERMYLEKRR